ncbi:shikimate dehydrogenase [Ornithinimicrobium sufpigmenti]|uniref:shikimate dehydrogenase n=1 Tax=Ornithinimicrobium sufpigmenti TaxID=2508882 RepID=UPI00192DFC59|nr:MULTISPECIES: shikimate dehydrogenase [unclassified Ornithinimicrobium]
MLSGHLGPRRAAVVGSPVEHSLSPVLHRAAYTALGLAGWTYDRVQVAAGGLAAHVRSLGPEWVGLSVTMPGKEEALALADEASPDAVLAGAANTLVRRDDGWYADNTDILGLATALQRELERGGAGPPRRALVLGGGATARSAVLALRRLGAEEITLLVRDRLRPETAAMLERLEQHPGPISPQVRTGRLADGIPLDGVTAHVVVGTLPADAPAPDLHLPTVDAPAPVLLDATYAPWPSPLARAVADRTAGRVAVVRGTAMLLHQAVGQVELMTGRTAPLAEMAEALDQHLGAAR